MITGWSSLAICVNCSLFIGGSGFRLASVLFLLLTVDVLLGGSDVRVVGHLICGGLHSWLLALHTFLMHRLAHAVHILVLAVVLTLVVHVLLLLSIHIHSIVVHLALDWREGAWWSAHPQLLVLVLSLGELLLILLNGHIHELGLLALLVLEGFVRAASWHAVLGSLEHRNLLAVLLLLLPHLVDPLDQVHVVLHEARVVFAVLLEVARELLSVVSDVRLVRMSLTCMLGIGVDVLPLAVGFFFNPGLIETNNAFFELLIVSDVLDDFKDIMEETLLEHLLHVKFVTAVQALVLEALVAHLEIIDNQVQVVRDALEVLHLNLHLVDLLMERGNVILTRQNVTLQLLDLVIEHEFELLQLLSLLLELDDSGFFVLNGCPSGLQFGLLCLD